MITHGTDTMTVTAGVIARDVKDKTVILTGEKPEMDTADGTVQFAFRIPAERLVDNDRGWSKLRLAFAVEWDGGPAFPDPNGASMALKSPALDNNVGANWCEATTPYGAGDLGTPGAANDCAVPVPELVINEIMQNPSAVADSAGEWFEIHNPTAGAIDIDGWTVEDNDSDSFVIANGGPLLVPAGGYVVLGNNADSGTNGGLTVVGGCSGCDAVFQADWPWMRGGNHTGKRTIPSPSRFASQRPSFDQE